MYSMSHLQIKLHGNMYLINLNVSKYVGSLFREQVHEYILLNIGALKIQFHLKICLRLFGATFMVNKCKI